MTASRVCMTPAVALAVAVALAPAVADEPGEVVACAIAAWLSQNGPQASAIRAGPSVGHAVVARLPPPLETTDAAFAAEVRVTGWKNGWFRIARATLDDYISPAEPKIVFEGEGWMPGEALGLSLNRPQLFAAPSHDAPVVATLSATDPEGPASGADAFVVERLHACRGEWVEVEGTFLGTPLRGWAARTCANQVTTCP